VIEGDSGPRTATPYATGGGGVVLEHRYGACLLASVLTGDSLQELGDDATPVTVSFQAIASSPVDDLLVTGRTADGGERRVSIGVRRAPRLVTSDKASIPLLASYLQVVTTAWDEVRSGRWRLAIAVASPNPAVRQVGELTVIAKANPGDAGFRAEVARRGRTSRAVRTRLDHLDELVAAALKDERAESGETGGYELTWRLLSSLWVRELRLEGADKADRTIAVRSLRTVTRDGTTAQADDLFGLLAGLADDYAAAGAEVTEPMLRRDLSGTSYVPPSLATARARSGAPRSLDTQAAIEVPGAAGAVTGRVVANDWGDLAARTLHPMKRLGLLAKHLDLTGGIRTDGEGNRRLLLLIGEGGIGKSVLLGQYLDQLASSGNRGVVLVSCASIEAAACLTARESANRALGEATGNDVARDKGLLQLLDDMRTRHGAVSMLVDTLDLKINESSVIAFASLLADALEIGDVIATCRTQEYRSFLLDGTPRLTRRIDPVVVPSLDDEEIIAWAQEYLADAPTSRQADRDAFLTSLRSGVQHSKSLRNVCSVPVRLALTCQTFADEGHVPPELTVVGLFDRYWDERIAKHGGLARTPQARAKRDAALKVASKVIRPEAGELALRVPIADLGEADQPGLDLLTSEGVLRDHAENVEFFHQTFAEYSHARWLLSIGIHAPAVEALRSNIAAGRTNLWDIVTSLLLQVGDIQDYHSLAGQFPVTSPQSARARASAAVRRAGSSALAELRDEVAGKAELIPAILDVLADAPFDRVPEAYSWTVDAVRAHPAKLARKGATVLASLLPRHEADQVPQALASGLDALIDTESHLDPAPWRTLIERVIVVLNGHPAQQDALPVLRERYALLGPEGQRAALRAHLALRGVLSGPEIGQLASDSLAENLPNLTDQEAIELVSLFWSEPTVRSALRWHSLEAMVRAPLPGGWQNGQVRFAVRCAQADEGARGELFDSAYQAFEGHTENSMSAVKQLAELFPEWTASRLLALGRFDTRRVIKLVNSTAESLARGATPDQRTLILQALRAARLVEPRDGFSAEICLAADRIPEHREILQAVKRVAMPRGVFESLLDAWLFRTPAHVRGAIAAELRQFLAAPDAETRQRRARLEAAFAHENSDSRNWITDQVLRGDSSQVASTAVVSFRRAVAETEMDGAILKWLTSLLPGKYPEATASVVMLIKDERHFTAEVLRSGRLALIPAATACLRSAAEAHQKDLSRVLVELLLRLNRVAGLPSDVIGEVFDLIRARLKPPPEVISQVQRDDQFAALRDLKLFVGQVMTKCLAIQEIFRRVGEVLLALEDIQVQSKARETLVVMLTGLGHDDLPNTCTWMGEIFATPGVAVGVQMAIAEVMLKLDGTEPDGRAAALEHVANCPIEVATYLQGKLTQ
jgi:hypothetical protein